MSKKMEGHVGVASAAKGWPRNFALIALAYG
jgi:hypothetical protein